MFCKNCGKEIQNDSKFCPLCGQRVETINLTSTYILKKNINNINDYKRWSFFSLVNMIIVLLLSSSKWIKIESVLGGGNIGISGLFNILEKLSKFGNVDVLYLIAFLYGITILITFGVCTIYSLKIFRLNIFSEQKNDINWFFLVTMILIVLYVAFFVLAVGIFLGMENNFIQISLSAKFYLVFAFLCLNRFVLLPKMKKGYFTKNAHILYEDEWFCEKCNCKNKLTDKFCKYCGQYR